MIEQKCWFTAVAGASAGAITAALVAAGLPPDRIERETDRALNQVRTSKWAGLRRLQARTGYFPSDGLRTWLDDLFREQVAIKRGSRPASPVTFDELFNATNIELNVVAANLSARCEVVFSHIDTPKCAVADAVVASSSIPFAFPSRLLQVTGENDRVAHHTIVDGGVWSNFPIHIFEDSAFRRAHNRAPELIDPEHILGFVLHEPVAEKRPHGDAVMFVDDIAGAELMATEWLGPSVESEASAMAAESLGPRIAGWTLYPFSLLGRLAQWNGGVDRGRWPQPSSMLGRNLLYSVDGLLGGIHPPLFAAVALAVVGFGAWDVVGALGRDFTRSITATDWREPTAYAVRPAASLLTAVALAIAVLTSFVAALGVLANHVLLRAARRILYGLAMTYVAGPGAPAWAVEHKDNIVALPIPAGVTTLTFSMSDQLRRATIASAKDATTTKLKSVLREELAIT